MLAAAPSSGRTKFILLMVCFGPAGARGLAHLGVIRSMNEQGIPIDCIGGTSQVRTRE